MSSGGPAAAGVSAWLAWRGSLRGWLLLAGTLGFLLPNMSMSMLSAYNALFLVYLALFTLSLYAFVLSMLPFDLADLPRGWVAGVLFAVGGFLLLAWLGRILGPMLRGQVPALENTTTLVVQAAVVIPFLIPTLLNLATAVLLLCQVDSLPARKASHAQVW